MEEYKDEYTSFERESKTQEIIGTIIGTCFFVALFVFYVYDLITNAPIYSSVLGFLFVSAIVFYILINRPLKNIEVIERHICKRLDKEGYPHEKREGTLYITKNDNSFRVQLSDSVNGRIKRLFVIYDFGDDNFDKVSKDGWNRVANSININNTRTIFVSLEDHFCCCYQTAIGNARDFMSEFERAYYAIGEAMKDYNRIYPYVERDYPNVVVESNSIGFKTGT